MAKTGASKGKGRRKAAKAETTWARPRAVLARWFRKGLLIGGGTFVAVVILFRFVHPPLTPYMAAEWYRTGKLSHEWRPLEAVAPPVPLAVMAAEDANFCLHWGFDLNAIRAAVDEGARRGASTLTQQTVKNLFLWQGRSWIRKFLETLMTPVVEAAWTKRRILEVYLNIAEFDEGVFGIEAAARHYFGKGADKLTLNEAALLAAILPDPKGRDAARPGPWLRKRAESIADGALTLRLDGRASCIQG